MCAAVLSLEGVAVGLSTPVMIVLSDVSVGKALLLGLGLALACLVLAGLLRWEGAYIVGFVLQAAAIALGLLVSMMFVLGVIFAALWTAAYLLGRKIERDRALAYAALGGDGSAR